MAQAKWDSGRAGSNVTLSNGDLTATHTDTGDDTDGVGADHVPISSGKYYWEVTYTTVTGTSSFVRDQVGIIGDAVSNFNNELGGQATGWMYCSNGNKRRNGLPAAYGTTWADGDIIGIAFDRDNDTLWFSKNGTWQNSATITDVEDNTNVGNAAYSGVTAGSYRAAVSVADLGATQSLCTLEAISGDLTYTVPDGFTAGLPDAESNDGAVSIALGADGDATVSPIHGDGAVGIGLGADGVGSLAIRADGAVGIGLGADGVGTLPIRADGAVSQALGADGTGTMSPIHGDAAVGINVGADGTGTIKIRGDGAVSLRGTTPSTGTISPLHADGVVGVGANADGTSTVFPKFRGAFTLPLPTTTGEQLNGLVLTGGGTLQLPEVAAEAVSGNAISGGVTLPSVQAVGYGAPNAAFNLPSITASGAGVTGEILNLNSTLAKVQASGSFSLDGFYTGGGDLPRIGTSGFLTSGTIATADIILRKLYTTAVSLTGEVGSGAGTLPSLTSTGQILADGELTASIKLPSIRVEGVIENGATFSTTAWAMNTENFGTSNYLNYDFHTLGQIGGLSVGINTAGIYLLSGDDDVGTAIESEFLFGFDDFGTEFEKNVPNVYVGYTADNNMVLLTNVDGQERQRENDVTHKAHQSGLTRARVTLGKGVKSKYWQIGMRNCNGGDFEIDELGALFRELARKV